MLVHSQDLVVGDDGYYVVSYRSVLRGLESFLEFLWCLVSPAPMDDLTGISLCVPVG